MAAMNLRVTYFRTWSPRRDEDQDDDPDEDQDDEDDDDDQNQNYDDKKT